MMLEDGRGGFNNYHEYREILAGLMYRGEAPPRKGDDGRPVADRPPDLTPAESVTPRMRSAVEGLFAGLDDPAE